MHRYEDCYGSGKWVILAKEDSQNPTGGGAYSNATYFDHKPHVTEGLTETARTSIWIRTSPYNESAQVISRLSPTQHRNIPKSKHNITTAC